MRVQDIARQAHRTAGSKIRRARPAPQKIIQSHDVYAAAKLIKISVVENSVAHRIAIYRITAVVYQRNPVLEHTALPEKQIRRLDRRNHAARAEVVGLIVDKL